MSTPSPLRELDVFQLSSCINALTLYNKLIIMAEQEYSPQPSESKKPSRGEFDLTKRPLYEKVKSVFRRLDQRLAQKEAVANKDIDTKLHKEAKEFEKAIDHSNTVSKDK